MTAEEMKMSMFYTYVSNRNFTYIPTHYIVWCNWDWVKVNELDTIVWATLNADANQNGIHIEIVWDFNINEPNDSQYATVNQLIQWILEKYPDMEVKGHQDFQNKNCPWKNFDWSRITTVKREEITFKLSRYYSVMPNQSEYYLWRTYEEDFAINCSWDPLHTADWHELKDEERWKVVACPKEYPLWTRFFVEWIWVVICHDRWWKIIKQWESVRLDLWMWVWMSWLNRIYNNSIRWWEYKWYVLD